MSDQGPTPSPRQDRVFFGAVATWFVLVNFVGFAPSFFIRQIPEPLPLNQVIHGVVYSGWMLLFLVQASLVSAGQLRVHRTLGAASIILLLAMIPVGFNVVLTKAAAGLKSVDAAGFNLFTLSLAFGFAFAGIAYRTQSFIHKRLMMFAVLTLSVAAADRVAFVVGMEEIPLFRKVLAVTPALVLVIYDSVMHRRLPLLSGGLLAASWINIRFFPSDLIFMRPVGETILKAITPIFVW